MGRRTRLLMQNLGKSADSSSPDLPLQQDHEVRAEIDSHQNKVKENEGVRADCSKSTKQAMEFYASKVRGNTNTSVPLDEIPNPTIRGDKTISAISKSTVLEEVLLSQCHRHRALVLLGRFLDMGPWAPFSRYECFLKIMILSVLKNTCRPVKFWFIKNYISPQFKDVIPHMAQEYGFEYEFELITYKWPSWLHKQKEKQQIIWAYKILFFDVIFLLSLEKVIFVDADQIVRTDMGELYDMDIKRKPLAYTPFCDNNKDMDGYRFETFEYIFIIRISAKRVVGAL
ncbi:hypothetical protein GIB67_018043 [Kingdonia uniflora]|uniref:Glucosyltransferase 24 catalytic domain-containing protein n=1 Tax=Kingdonia uniflora TaxID=39325 RepID=A0A7J7NWI0_9MAGN|nr:hypothetical protein GIB67_018043 [Kingdonia uniflora]